MNINMMMSKLNMKNKGQFFKVSWISDVPVKAGFKRQGISVNKLTTTTARYGIKYTNMKSVQMKVEKGEINLTHELPWGNWKSGYEGILIDHTNKTGEQNTYLRLYTTPNKAEVSYFLNGKPITKAELISSGVVQDSYWKKDNSSVDCFTINVRNIIDIL